MAQNTAPYGCAICAHAVVKPDPDPDDWFCDDDVKVICDAVPIGVDGKPVTPNVITCACRPYRVTAECSVNPSWCPQHGEVTPRSL